MDIGTFRLIRFNGEEVYDLSKAETFALEGSDGIRLWFEVNTNPEPIRHTCPDTIEMRMHPSAEVVIDLPSIDWNSLPGQIFAVPYAIDSSRNEAVALLYYCEHEDLNNNRIEILAKRHDRLHVRWTGTVRDINYYDGSKPESKVEIEGWFKIKAGDEV